MKRLLLLIALSIGASMAIADHDKTANYNSATGELELPRVSVDGAKLPIVLRYKTEHIR